MFTINKKKHPSVIMLLYKTKIFSLVVLLPPPLHGHKVPSLSQPYPDATLCSLFPSFLVQSVQVFPPLSLFPIPPSQRTFRNSKSYPSSMHLPTTTHTHDHFVTNLGGRRPNTGKDSGSFLLFRDAHHCRELAAVPRSECTAS